MKTSFTLLLDDIPVTVERRRIKNMYLRVRPDGGVLLTAPWLMPATVIEQFARARLSWLQKHLRAALPQDAPQDAPGEALLLFGEPYRLEVVSGAKRARAEHDPAKRAVRLHLPADASDETRARALDALYRRMLGEAVSAAAPNCEQIVGRRASIWKLRDMTTRWGTCNTATAAITLNLQLVHRDPVYLRYVMIHELAHLHEPSHNARFYALMDRFLPEWKQLRKQLREGG